MKSEDAFPWEGTEGTLFQAKGTADARKCGKYQTREGLLIGADCGGVLSEEAHEVRTKEF